MVERRKRKIQKNRKKEKSKKIEKRKKSKKIEKEKVQKIEKNQKKENQKKKKNLFSVVLDKICVFCLYPIPDSQQYVKRGSCRRPILSGLLCLFSILGLRPICDEFRIWASNLVRFYLSSLSHLVSVIYFVLFRI